MNHYSVTVRTESSRHTYSAIAACSADAAQNAYDLYGVCAVTVRAMPC